MKYSRLGKIADYVQKRDFASWDELCEVFGRSKNTLRRDVMDLVGTGALEKVYGGVRASRPATILHNFIERSATAPDEKAVIGALAAEFVEDHDVVYVDSGTTTLNMLPHLAGRVGVTLISNNLHAIYYCVERLDFDVISLGGKVNRAIRSFDSDRWSLDKLEAININKAFMGATGVSIEKGITNTMTELPLKRKIVERSGMRFLLADSGKFDRFALMAYAELADFGYVVTDRPPSERYRDFFVKSNIRLVFPGGEF